MSDLVFVVADGAGELVVYARELVSPSVSAQYAVFDFSGLTLCLTAIRFFRADCQPRRLDL
jgi:hypothetical protein